MNPQQLRKALWRTYDVLLARHGSPNAVQLGSVEPLLAGRDLLLCAPTASGKTEAYLAPLCELYCIPRDRDEPALLLVSPTRALANDLYRRVAEPMQRLGIPCGRWTGDHHDKNRMQVLTILTPESLDSRLARSRHALASVRAVVLDELHVLDGTARGDQLRLLMARLRHGQRVQVVAASATVPDPESMAGRYLESPEIIRIESRRKILARTVVAPGPADLRRELLLELRRGFRKVLAFANSREEVELRVRELKGSPPFGAAVLAHHGSLARSHRLQVEERFLKLPMAICISTSTMELGIDIGDVDMVLLLGPPPSVASLLQRAGRGGRRRGHSPVLAVARDQLQRLMFQVMLKACSKGDYLEQPYHFKPGVLIQQAISLLHENPMGWVGPRALRARLSPDLQEAWSEEALHGLLAHAAGNGWLHRAGSARWVAGEKTELHWNRGRLHANLPQRSGVEVRDFMTGDPIGTVANVDDDLGLSGSGRKVLRVEEGRAVTREIPGDGLAVFQRGPRPIMSKALARRLAKAAGIPVPCHGWADGSYVLIHGLGTSGGLLLGAVMRGLGSQVRRAGPLGLVLRSAPLKWPTARDLDSALSRCHTSLATALSMGSFHSQLPAAEQRRAVESALDLQGLRQLLLKFPPPEHDSKLLGDAGWF